MRLRSFERARRLLRQISGQIRGSGSSDIFGDQSVLFLCSLRETFSTLIGHRFSILDENLPNPHGYSKSSLFLVRSYSIHMDNPKVVDPFSQWRATILGICRSFGLLSLVV